MDENEPPDRASTKTSREPDLAKRRPYEPPALVEYGSVAKLTQGTLSRSNDGPGGGFRMMMNCL